jgi:prolyl-tRNA synthetase
MLQLSSDVKILILAEQCKVEVVEIAQQSWEKRIECLRIKWFIDAKGQPKKGVGWGEKDGFCEDLRPELEVQFEEIFMLIRGRLNFPGIYNENIEEIGAYFTLFDKKIKNKLLTKFTSDNQEISMNIGEYKKHGNDSLEALVDKIWGDIRWEEVVNFKDEVYPIFERMINTIFDDRVKVLTESISQKIEFYNDFLERQQRYQQETPEEREAEKTWINKQRRELERMKYDIDTIWNESVS